MMEKDISPKFCKCADLKIQASTGLSVIHHDQMDIREQASTKILRNFFIQ